MTEPRDPIDPQLSAVLDADRDIPAADDALRERLRERLAASRAHAANRQWRAPVDAAPRRKGTARRRAIFAGLAAAAALVLAIVGAGMLERAPDGASERPTPLATAPDEPPAAGPDRAAGGATKMSRPTLELKLVDDDGPYMDTLAEHVAADDHAIARGITVEFDAWEVLGAPIRAGAPTADDGRPARSLADHTRGLTRSLATAKRRVRVFLAASDRQALEHYLQDLFAREPSLAPGADRQLLLGRDNRTTPPRWITYYVHLEPALTGDHVTGAEVVAEPVTALLDVLISLDDEGARRMAAVSTSHASRKLAVVIDGVVHTAPVLHGPLTGKRLSITAGDEQRDADALAREIRAAAGP